MRKLLVAVASAFTLTATPVFASEFCDGYKEGYEAGYKDAKNTNLAPLTPLCPLKPLKNFGDPEDDFRFGYQSGFKDGYRNGMSESGSG